MGGELFEGEGKRRAKSKKEEKEERIVDWSILHANILELIADQLTIDIADYIRFRNICKTWHATKPHSGTHPPQLPWLLLRCDYNIQHLIFFSFSDNRFHSIQTPANDKRIIGSCDGWLVLNQITSQVLSILNPLTGAHINLPALPSYLLNIEDSYPLLKNIAMSSNPSTHDRDCIIVIISTSNNSLLSIRLGEDDEWTLVDDKTMYHDVIYYEGSFYAVDGTAQVSMFDSSFEKMTIIGLRRELSNTLWQFVVLSGELLVLRNISIEHPINYRLGDIRICTTERIEILKLNMKGLLPSSLEEATSLGNNIVFLGINSRSISCPVAQYPRGKQDTVYIHHCYIVNGDGQYVYCRSGIYDLKNASFAPVTHDDIERMCNDFLPMWYTPCLF